MDTSLVKPDGGGDNMANLAALMDVQLAVSIRFGETEMLLEDVVKLGIGSVIELNSGVDDPVELIVNGRCFARGEVVTVDAFYGIKITEITSVGERIQSVNS
ncbi:MAG TPA: flagellar motor switch protein FliN [Terriglobia bacterium]|nr:flagellar motor switch protein FliN [Terriglobia bacterium]